MSDVEDGLNDREELLDYLRFLLRYEDELINDGWYSESDFYEEVFKTINRLSELSKK